MALCTKKLRSSSIQIHTKTLSHLSSRERGSASTLIRLRNSLMFYKSPLPVACKRFPYAPDFHREWDFLQGLNSLQRHDGVIQELAAVLYDGTYHLLLPLADSDLAKILIQTDASTISLKNLLDQACQLADAVSWLHAGIHTADGKKLIACHVDLKPANILVFLTGVPMSAGNWLITDFSTSTLTDEDGVELLPAPRLVADIYSAPEIQTQPNKNSGGAECDVWSLGCILFEIEILLWFVDGREEYMEWIDRWVNMPCFYEEWMGERRLTMRVCQWLGEGVSSNTVEGQSIQYWRELILYALKIAPVERPTAEDLKERLMSISSQC
ncbi:hypothetical protein IFR04_001410 [Cadophora malorum]|uniref:Protein kinase domain-containing protein n=1 Tax=Cadophora malorum TaxID=108018 RepID=A0A8H7WIR5_9HELO|nr:hypothetical protein IFR04_001410 [Cadophora malorum]